MAAKITVKLNHDGIREMLYSDGVAGAVKDAAERVARAAGEGYEVTEKQDRYGSKLYPGRVGYGVKTATYEAMLDEAVNGTLSKAVQSCR